MTWEKLLILCGLVLLLGVPCLTYNQHAPGTLANTPAFSQGLYVTDAESKQLVTSARFSLVYAWRQVITNLRTACHNHILQAKKRVTLTDSAVRSLIHYLSP